MELVELNGNTNQPLSNHVTNKTNQLAGSALSKQQIINHGDVLLNEGNHNAPQYPGANNYTGNHQHNQWQPTTHRELPVDVPDSFIAVVKQSPRFPPPKPHRQQSPPTPNAMSFDNQQLSGNVAHSQLLHYNQSLHMQNHNLPPANINNSINNSSLRDSKKLKQLEQQNKINNPSHGIQASHLQPAINQAFEPDEDESTVQNNQNRQANIYNQPQAHVAPLPDLCSVYSRLQRNLNSEFTDVANDANLSKLLSIYTTVIQQQKKRFELPEILKTNTDGPSGTNQTLTKATDLLHSVISILQEGDMSQDAVELLAILTKYEIQGVCSAFERIAQSFDFATKPTSPTTKPTLNSTDNMNHAHQHHTIVHTNPNANQYIVHNPLLPMNADMENNVYPHHPGTDFDMGDMGGVRYAKVEKTSCQPLGATVRNEIDGSVVIGRVVSGGAAAESGLLHEGDEILEVNGIEMRGKNVNEVFDILNEMKGTLTFMIRVRSYPRPMEPMSKERIFVKALFEYKAHEDEYIPCKDLGMSFDKGEILQIIDRSDPDWWQAYREADSQNSLAGLIPSQSFHIRKERVLSESTNSTDAFRKYNRTDKRSPASILLNCGKGTSPRRRKKSLNIPMTPEEIPTYEEVCCYYPKGNMKRPIVMIGPTNIGRQEIRHRLLQEQDRFAAAIPHTTRPIKDREKNGLDYFYVSRAHFEADVKAGKFVEHGEYEKHYYGTSFEAIDAVVQSGKTCVLNLHVPSILILRQGPAGPKLKPYFVFVKPPTQIEKLNRLVAAVNQTIESPINSDLQKIIDEAKFIESHYRSYIDMILSISDIEQAYQELLKEINRLECEPQWIPKFWMQGQS